MKTFPRTKGASLIEMLVYVAILVLLSSTVVAIVLSLSHTFEGIRAARALSGGATNSLERMVRSIRSAEGVVTAESVLGVHPGHLTLQRSLQGGGTEKTEFYLENGTLKIRIDGIEEGVLTPDLVSVESLVFTLQGSGVSNGVRIETVFKGEKGGATVTRAFDLFAILRRSY